MLTGLVLRRAALTSNGAVWQPARYHLDSTRPRVRVPCSSILRCPEQAFDLA